MKPSQVRPTQGHEMPVVPLLTIGIPTYNRAELLRLGLKNLFAARRGFEAEVEVVVCDNASSDETQAMLAEFAAETNTRFVRNANNIGGHNNFLKVATELAQGEYCWLFGDDDFMQPHAIREVLVMLREHRDLDFFVLNHFVLMLEERNRLIANGVTDYCPEPSRSVCLKMESGQLDHVGKVLELGTGDFRLFTHITSQIIRTSVWRAARPWCNGEFNGRIQFDRLDNTYPHLMFLLEAARNRPVWYSGPPVVGAVLGSQEWAGATWLNCVFVSYELIAASRRVGVSPRHQRRMVKFWLKYWLEFLPQLCGRSRYYTPPPGLLRRFVLRSLWHPWQFLPLLARQLAHDGRRFLGTRAGRIGNRLKVAPDGSAPRPGV